MSIFGWFSSMFGSSVNPSSALPMNKDSGIDIGGNPFGTDSMSSFASCFDSVDTFSDPFSTSGIDDFSCGCGMDDSCSIDTSTDIGGGFGDI
jgi:hypothetical protein